MKRIVRQFKVGELKCPESYEKTDLVEFIAGLESLRSEVPADQRPYIEIDFDHGYDNAVSAVLTVSYERLETEAEAQERAAIGVAKTKRLEDAERAQLEKLKAKYEK